MADETQNFEQMFETVKHVTRPLLKFDGDKPVFVKITGEIHTAKPLSAGRARKDASGEVKEMAPPELVDVEDLAHSNRPSQMIVNAVLRSELNDNYPNNSYVGKCFRITKSDIQGKRYKAFEVLEIRPKGQTTQEQHTAPAATSHKPAARR